MDISKHLLTSAVVVASPNADYASSVEGPELVVIHNISLPPGEFGTGMVEKLFTNTLPEELLSQFEDLRDLRVSSHLFIARSGDITQFVPFNRVAWHAGVSSWGGRTACNRFSLGIEVEGTDHVPYTESQYEVLFDVLQTLINHYDNLSLGRIVGHAEVAPDRKTDPGSHFDWARLYSSLAKKLG